MLPPAVAPDEPPQPPEEEEKVVEPETTEDEKPEPKLPYEVETTDGYADADQKFDLVAVHGLYSSNKSWASKKEGSWLKDLAVQKSWEARVVRYAWDAEDLKKDLYRRDAITREALKLLNSVVELRKEQVQPLPLAFFAHDIGGIIVKEALFLAGQYENKYADIRCSTRVIALFGVPNICNSLHHMEANIVRFLVTDSVKKRALQDARSLAKSVIAVNDSFLQTRMLTRTTIFNGIAKDQTLEDQVFDNATTLFCTPYEVILEIKKPHKDLIDEPGDDDDFHGLATLGMKRVATFPWRNDGMSPFIDVIDFQAVPVYPLKTLCDVPHAFAWLSDNSVFKEWQNNRNIAFLHIYGTPNSSEVAQYGLQVVESGRDSLFEILYFKFDKHDIRRNSIAAMANSFMSQILSQCRDSPGLLIKDLEPPDYSDCWTDKDATIFLDKLRVCMGNTGRVTWILDGLDQCDESSHSFLSQLLSLPARSEQYFKVLITSTDDKYLRQTLSEFPVIDVREAQPPVGVVPTPSFPFMTEVLQDRPHLSYIESSIKDLVKQCGDDALRHLLLEWFRCARLPTKRAMEEEISLLYPPTPRKVCERILQMVTNDRRAWARKVMVWILRSFRPLTPGELEMALTIDEQLAEPALELTARFDFMGEIKECFGPLVVIQNGEVHLGHPSARDILQDASGEVPRPWFLLDAPEEGHRSISEVCIRYLALPDIKDQLAAACKASPNTDPVFEGQPDLLSYAIQFWPQHYRLGYEVVPEIQITKNISSFLQDGKALQRWAAAAWYSSNPKMRSDRLFLSPLPVIASLGLEKLVLGLIKGQERHNDRLIAMALVEAARNGHAGVVQAILQTSSIDQSGHVEAMIAAARSAEFDVLRDVLDHAKEQFKDLQLPDVLTSRVAFFGVDDVLESLITAGAQVNTAAQPEFSPPLHCAVFGNHISTVDILLKQGAEHSTPNAHWKNYPPIVVAAKYGRGAMVKRLLEAGAPVESKDSDEKSAFWWAVLLAQYEAMQVLIDAEFGADVEGSDVDKPIVHAVMSGKREVVDLFLEKEVDVDVLVESDDFNQTPLIAAADLDFKELASLLLEKKAAIDKPLSNGVTALFRATRNGHLDMMKLLVAAGADVKTKAYEKKWGLLQIAHDKGLDGLKFLLDSGADIDTTCIDGTALYL
ncbi:ankyrin, partial [Stipitochalara longipes BDJ]